MAVRPDRSRLRSMWSAGIEEGPYRPEMEGARSNTTIEYHRVSIAMALWSCRSRGGIARFWKPGPEFESSQGRSAGCRRITRLKSIRFDDGLDASGGL